MSAYFLRALNDIIQFQPPYVLAIFGPPFLIVAIVLIRKNKNGLMLNLVWKMILLFVSFIYIMGVSLVTRVAVIPFSIYERFIENRPIFYLTESELQLVPFRSIIHIMSLHGFGTTLMGNVLLLLPLGFLLPVWFRKLKGILRTGCSVMLFSAGIELLQIIFGVGIGSVDDVILNTLGGLIGYSLFKLSVYGKRRFIIRRKNGAAQDLF
ncbi:VanZ family protein [Bacillus infantis]|uniref:VanZ family protein n=1 Tax=Bacillus infantis TaxID=324767 RepID=UPI003CE78033